MDAKRGRSMRKGQEKKKKQPQGSCECCANYAFDDEYEQYICMVDLDEDEYYRFLSEPNYACPYFKLDDEYAIVRKQN